ncbi:MAG: hypothetical protein IPM54_21135 [Polyangiaceae bacterium]|nr:hypothetical protein [Polyangiaceae bacterium]
MNGVHERLYQDCGNADVTTCPVASVVIPEDFDGDGNAETNVDYELFASYSIACGDKVIRPILLHPVTGPEVRTENPDGSPPLFSTYFRYFASRRMTRRRSPWARSGFAARVAWPVVS